MLNVAIGHSKALDSKIAIEEILHKCKNQLDNKIPQAGMIFMGMNHDHALVLSAINSTYPAINLIGCSSYAEISSGSGVTNDSIALALFESNDIEFHSVMIEAISHDLNCKISSACKQVQESTNGKLQFCISTPDSLSINNSTILQELKTSLGSNFPVFGGFAADNWYFKNCLQFHNNAVVSNAAPVLFMSGAVSFAFGVASGWEPVSQPAKITRSVNNIIYKIEKKTAIEFYDHYLGKHTLPAAEFPLAVIDENNSDQQLQMLAPIKYNREDSSVAFAAEIPKQCKISISNASREDLIAAAKSSIQKALAQFTGTNVQFILLISSAARKELLGTKTIMEYNILHEAVSSETKIIGFYAYGEICPEHKDGESYLHNGAITTLVIGG